MAGAAWRLEVEVIEASDLPSSSSSGCYCCITALNETASSSFLQTMQHAVSRAPGVSLGTNTFVPQYQTISAPDAVNPTWQQAFSVVDAVQLDLYQETECRNMVPFYGQPLMLLLTLHAQGTNDCLGKVVIAQVRPGPVIDQWCHTPHPDPASRVRRYYIAGEDRKQAMGSDGQPSALHIRLLYSPQPSSTDHQRPASPPASHNHPSPPHHDITGRGMWDSASTNATSPNAQSSPPPGWTPPPQAPSSIPTRASPSSSSNQTAPRSAPLLLAGVGGGNHVASPKRLHRPKVLSPSLGRGAGVEEDGGGRDPGLALGGCRFECDDRYMVEGYKGGGVEVVGRRTLKPVHVRGCSGGEDGMVINIEGVTEAVVVELCQGLRVVCGRVTREITVIGCVDVELVVGGSMPRSLWIASRHCMVLTGKDTWIQQMIQVGCTALTVHAAHSHGLATMQAKDLVDAKVVERVVLPDTLTTKIAKGGGPLTTQCGFGKPEHADTIRTSDASFGGGPSLRAHSLTGAGEAAAEEMGGGDAGVGLLLRKSERGLRVAEVSKDGPAERDGRILVGDILVSVDGKLTAGRRLRDIGTALSGAPGTFTKLSVQRFSVLGTDTFDISLQRASDTPSPPWLPTAQPPSPRRQTAVVRTPPAPSPPRAPSPPPSLSQKSPSPAISAGGDGSGGMDGGVGLGVRPARDGSYKVSGMVPGGPAEASGQIHIGDVMHSVDGVIVCDKPYSVVRDMVRGETGKRVMIAFLRPEARPEHLHASIESFDHWRPVVLTRVSNTTPPPLQPPSETVAVALWMGERCLMPGEGGDKAALSVQIAIGIADLVQASARRVNVVDLLSAPDGSVVADLVFLPDEQDSRSSHRLAAELVRQIAQGPSPARMVSATLEGARHAEVRGPPHEVPPLAEVLSSYRTSVTGTPMRAGAGGSPVKMAGVGVIFAKNNQDDYEIREVGGGGAAKASGNVFVGDVLVSVDGVMVRGREQMDVQGTIRGREGTEVVLGLVRNDGRGKERFVSVPLVRGGGLAEARRLEERVREQRETMRRKDEEMARRRRDQEEEEERLRRMASKERELEMEREKSRILALEVEKERERERERLQQDRIREEIEREQRKRKEMEMMKEKEDRRLMALRIEEEERRLIEQTKLEEEHKALRETLERERRLETIRREEKELAERSLLLYDKNMSSDPCLDGSQGNYGAAAGALSDYATRDSTLDPYQQQGLELLNSQTLSSNIHQRLYDSQSSNPPNQPPIPMYSSHNNIPPSRDLYSSHSSQRGTLPSNFSNDLPHTSHGVEGRLYSSMDIPNSHTTPSATPGGLFPNIGLASSMDLPPRHTHEYLHPAPQDSVVEGAEEAPGGKRTVILNRAPPLGMQPVRGQTYGVGVSFQVSKMTGHAVIVSLSEGGTAAQSRQVHVGDVIHTVNNVNVQGKRVPDVVALIKGPAGSTVVLELQDSTTALPGTLTKTIGAGGASRGLHFGGRRASDAGSRGSSGDLYRSQGEQIKPPPRSTRSRRGSQAQGGGGELHTRVRLERRPRPGTQASAGEHVGVGIGFDRLDSGMFQVSALFPGGSADESGAVQLGDKIVEIDGMSVQGKRVDEVVSLLRGLPQTFVEVTLELGAQRPPIPPTGRPPQPPPNNAVRPPPRSSTPSLYASRDDTAEVQNSRGAGPSSYPLEPPGGQASTAMAATHLGAGQPRQQHAPGNGLSEVLQPTKQQASLATTHPPSTGVVSPGFIPGVQTHVNQLDYPPENPVSPVIQDHKPIEAPAVPSPPASPPQPAPRHSPGPATASSPQQQHMCTCGFSVTRGPPFFISRVGQLLDPSQAAQGEVNYSNVPIEIGDSLLSVSGVSLQSNIVHDQLVSMLQGLPLSVMAATICKTSRGDMTSHNVSLLRHTPTPDPSVLTAPLPASPAPAPAPPSAPGTPPVPQTAQAASTSSPSPITHSLTVSVKHGSGLAVDDQGRPPTVVCKLRMLLPNIECRDMGLATCPVPSSDPQFSENQATCPLSAAQLPSAQLEVTLWDALHGRDGFIGEIIVNVNKLAQMTGKHVEHTFIVKSGSSFALQRPPQGLIYMGLRLDSVSTQL